MISSIEKYFDDIPKILTSEDTNRSVEALLKNEEDIHPHIYTHDIVKAELEKMYPGKCAYCESKLEHIEIDHYRPLDRYPWLAYEWSNLLPICSGCNKSKASQFPVKGSRVETPPSDRSQWRADSESFLTEKPLLLHPGLDTPEDHLIADEKGRIHPKNNSERGRATIDICGLNRPDLVGKRMSHIKSLVDIIEKLSDEQLDTKSRKNLISKYLFASTARSQYTLLEKDVIDEKTRDRFLKKAADVLLPPNKVRAEESEDLFFNEDRKESLPRAIKQIQIENYHSIVKTGIKDIPSDTQWIFLTGENGFGKTCVLQAMVIGLFGKRDGNDILTDDDCNISVELKADGENRIYHMGNPKFESFAAYGPSRLTLQNQESQNDISKKSTVTYSLFNTDGVLLNIEYELLMWYLEKDVRYDIVTQALLDILPHVSRIEIVDKKVFYAERETEAGGKTYPPMPFQNLASGHKSIIAMIGDMLIRFFKQQRHARGTEDLHGIVFIDELDSHLHPKWQRELPALFSEVFPKVQFVASTHSVIPFLGAPENSVFLKVTRTTEEGIQMQRVEMDIRNLLPNILLTSPLFDMERLSQQNNTHLATVRTEDTYDEMRRNDEIRLGLKAFEESDMDFPDDLFETKE